MGVGQARERCRDIALNQRLWPDHVINDVDERATAFNIGIHHNRLDCRLEIQHIAAVQRHVILPYVKVVQLERLARDDMACDERLQLVYVRGRELLQTQSGIIQILQQCHVRRHEYREFALRKLVAEVRQPQPLIEHGCIPTVGKHIRNTLALLLLVLLLLIELWEILLCQLSSCRLR